MTNVLNKNQQYFNYILKELSFVGFMAKAIEFSIIQIYFNKVN